MPPPLAKYLFISFYIQMLLSTFHPPLASKAPSGSRSFSHRIHRVKMFSHPKHSLKRPARKTKREHKGEPPSCSIKHELVIYLCAFFTVHQLFFLSVSPYKIDEKTISRSSSGLGQSTAEQRHPSVDCRY
jgi:hypothetical protein